MRTRRLLLSIPLVLVMPFLASCTATLDGITGVTVDDARQPIGLAASCHSKLSGAYLYRLGPTTSGPYDDRTNIAGWSITTDTTAATVTWPLTHGDTPSTTTETPLPEWPTSGDLYLAGWGDNHAVATNIDVTFTVNDLERITPGSVLTGTPNHLVTMDEFHQLACSRTDRSDDTNTQPT